MIISIIICTRDRASALSQTLDALGHVAVPSGIRTELIIVDNGSRDSTKDVVTSASFNGASVRYIWQPNGGKSSALNSALSAARGEILVMIDDDIRPAQQWLAAIIDPIARGQFDAVSGQVDLAPHLRRPWMSMMHAGWLASTEYLDPVRPASAVGANMAFHRRVLSRVPGFDPELGPGRLGLWEDTLFSLQMQAAGFRLGMAVDATVEHHFDSSRLTRPAFLSRARAEARSSAYVAWHWRHEDHRVNRLNLIDFQFKLIAKRLLRWREWHQPEGIAEWEMNLITGIEYDRCIRLEARRPRAYSKFGTSRLSSPPVSS